MTTWLIQPTKTEEDKIKLLTYMLEQADIDYHLVYSLNGKILNSDKSEFQFLDNMQYFVCGSYSLTRSAFLKQPSSVFSLENHPIERLWDVFGKDNFLNGDAKIINTNNIDWNLNQEYFVRPIDDTKSFNGGIYNQNTLKFEGNVILSNLKNIHKEHRFFIMNGEIITGSLYKINGELFESSVLDESATQFATKMIHQFDYPAYVIDIASIDNEYKIVELNCFNAAGFYLSNLYKIINSVEDYYFNKSKNNNIINIKLF